MIAGFHARAAKVTGRPVAELTTLSLASLRELVRGLDPGLVADIDQAIQRGNHLVDLGREACCPFHGVGGTPDLACGGDEPNFEGRHLRDCAVQGGGDCTCGRGPHPDEWL